MKNVLSIYFEKWPKKTQQIYLSKAQRPGVRKVKRTIDSYPTITFKPTIRAINIGTKHYATRSAAYQAGKAALEEVQQQATNQF